MIGRVLASLLVIAAAGSFTADARAQTDTQIAAARETFALALKDEQAHRFQDALDKYREVEQVKDTPQVRYRIGTCLVALGKLREARDKFTSIHAHPGNHDEQDTEQASTDLLKTLTPRIPDLTVKVTGPAASSSTLSIDNVTVGAGAATEVDPGEHVIVVAGAGVKRSETRMTVAEGTHQTITLAAEADVVVVEHPVVPPPPPPEPSSRRTYGFVTAGVGGALLVGSVVTIFLQRGQVSTINNDCPAPSFVCPTSKKQEVLSAQSAANTEGAVAVTLGIVGAIAGGVGAYLIVTSNTQIAVAPAPTGAMLQFGGLF